MKKIRWVLLIVIVFLIAGVLHHVLYQENDRQAAPAAARSTLDRVQESGILRCGYFIYEPFVLKNLTTGKMSGITVDYIEQTAAKQGLKVDWTEDISSFDQVILSLNHDRIDMLCVPCSPTDDLLKQIDFVGDFGRIPYYVYVRQDSKLTAEQLKTAHFVIEEGYIPQTLTPIYFPHARITSLQSLSSQAEWWDQLKYNKADAMINEHISAINYMTNNPNVIRRFDDTPLEIKTMSFPVKKDDPVWGAFIEHMTDTTQSDNNKLFHELIQKYGLADGALLDGQKTKPNTANSLPQ